MPLFKTDSEPFRMQFCPASGSCSPLKPVYYYAITVRIVPGIAIASNSGSAATLICRKLSISHVRFSRPHRALVEYPVRQRFFCYECEPERERTANLEANPGLRRLGLPWLAGATRQADRPGRVAGGSGPHHRRIPPAPGFRADRCRSSRPGPGGQFLAVCAHPARQPTPRPQPHPPSFDPHHRRQHRPSAASRPRHRSCR